MPYEGLTRMSPHGARWTGKIRLVPEKLDEPLHWRKPSMVFVNSMSDLFHEDVPFDFIDKVFAVMALCDGTRTNGIHHTFQVLTKRPERMAEYMNDPDTPYRVAAEVTYRVIPGWRPLRGGLDWRPEKVWPLPNVWLGTSVENQEYANKRIPYLLQTPAAVRFLSCEPLLGPVDLEKPMPGPACNGIYPPWYIQSGIHLVIAGGESGPGARPMHPDWARSLRDQCQAAWVPFFFKQWGEWVTESQAPANITLPGRSTAFWAERDGDGEYTSGDQTAVYKVGKKKAGRLLDSRTWDEMPAKVVG